MQTHYDTLGIAATATTAEIRGAFRSACLRFHPDRLVFVQQQGTATAADAAAMREAATARFHQCVEAANCLLDAISKARYDAFVFGAQAIDVVGRVSEACNLLDPDSEFEPSADNPQLFTRECRCGGTYSVVVASSRAEPAGTQQLVKKFPNCDSCSLVIEVSCPC